MAWGSQRWWSGVSPAVSTLLLVFARRLALAAAPPRARLAFVLSNGQFEEVLTIGAPLARRWPTLYPTSGGCRSC